MVRWSATRARSKAKARRQKLDRKWLLITARSPMKAPYPLERRMNNADSMRLISIYRKRAKRYDWTTLLLYVVGFRHWAYRKRAIESLALKQGDTVVELGCGTGLNFSLLLERVGPSGKIVGVDLTDAMLDGASARITAHGWSNVELVKSDAADFVFPSAVDGILSTFALTLVPEIR